MKVKILAALFIVYILTICLGVVLTAPANADEQEIHVDSDLLLAAARLNELLTEDKTSTAQNRNIDQNTNIAEEDDTNDAQPNDQHKADEFEHSLREFQAALLTSGMRKAFMHKLVQATTDEDLERLKRSNRRQTNRFKRSGFWWGCPLCDSGKVIDKVPCCDKPKHDNKPSPSL